MEALARTMAIPTLNASNMLGAVRADNLNVTARCAAKAKVVQTMVIRVLMFSWTPNLSAMHSAFSFHRPDSRAMAVTAVQLEGARSRRQANLARVSGRVRRGPRTSYSATQKRHRRRYIGSSSHCGGHEQPSQAGTCSSIRRLDYGWSQGRASGGTRSGYGSSRVHAMVQQKQNRCPRKPAAPSNNRW